MRLRAPSIGFCYLLLTVAVVPGFFDYINQPFFFELPAGSREREAGEAQYLLDLARDGDHGQRQAWLHRVLEIGLEHSGVKLVDAALAELERDGIDAEGLGLREIAPGEVWAYGLDTDGWTTATRPCTFILRNATSEARQVAIHFSTRGDGKASYATGSDAGSLVLAGDAGQKTGVVTAPPVAPGSSLAIRIGASAPVLVDGQQRGLKFERIEWLP